MPQGAEWGSSAGGNHLSCCHKWGSAEDGLKNGSGKNMTGADGRTLVEKELKCGLLTMTTVCL